MRTVVFLGAGASRAFGLPLTNEILEKMIRRLDPGPADGPVLFKGPNQRALASDFREALAVLYPGLDLQSKELTLPNITNVLSFLDHLIFYGYPASIRYGRDRLIRARRIIERGMLEVLVGGDLSEIVSKMNELGDEAGFFQRVFVERDMKSEERDVLRSFMGWLDAKRRAGPLTVVTTNYDVAVEAELFASFRLGQVAAQVDFGFDYRDPYGVGAMVPRPAVPDYRFYKLHGSLNWLRCDLCDQMYVNPNELIAYLSFDEEQHKWNTCHCGSYPLRHVIVAPSMVRDIRDPHLLSVWRNATEALRAADEWFLIGYSLPAEDLAIRSMLLRSLSARGLEESDQPLNRRDRRRGPAVTVVQLRQDAYPSYASLFKDKFTYIDGGLKALFDS